MKELFFLFILLNKILFTNNDRNKKNSYYHSLKGVYRIESFSTNYYFKIKKDVLLLFKTYSYFRLIGEKSNGFFIESIFTKKRIGIDDNDRIILYNYNEKKNWPKMIWYLIKIKNGYLIQSKYSLKYMRAKNFYLICYDKSDNIFNNKKGIIEQNFIFSFLKLYEEGELNSILLEAY